MLRVFACIALALVAGGCVTSRAPSAKTTIDRSVLATWFDCVRERGGVVISAHRALSADNQPENSIQAIEATGRDIPNAMVEFDLALTRDGRVVLMHDQTLERTTTGQGRISELSFAELRTARLKTKGGLVTDAPPPALTEALTAAGRAGVISALDFKPVNAAAMPSLAGAVVEEVRAAGAANRVVLITYSPENARALAALAPEMMISAVVKDIAGLDGLNPAHVLAWTSSLGSPLWAELAGRGIEVQFGTLGAPGRRLDDVYAEDGDVSEYRALHSKGAVVIATDTPLAVASVLGPALEKSQSCTR